jgi:hypothetical protein
MQTFLPYADFKASASALDYRRLGKQRVEALQILQILHGRLSRWSSHPAVIQWKGYEGALSHYGMTICLEWKARGYVDNLLPRFKKLQQAFFFLPEWMGFEPFHASHRSNLLRKNKDYYSQFNWKEPPNLPYVWPSKLREFPKGESGGKNRH